MKCDYSFLLLLLGNAVLLLLGFMGVESTATDTNRNYVSCGSSEEACDLFRAIKAMQHEVGIQFEIVVSDAI